MGPIKQITISGFRGILSPLSLQFVKGSTRRSMVIYGRNATGKSSITDAWEWFHTAKIGHLAREGAGPSSFPHRHATSGETFVEVQFEDDRVGTVRLNFDHSRITMPVPEGNIDEFRALAPHPCHIRFEDLTRFVYLTKAEKYDALAQLMGFTPQVEFQKALRRVLRQLGDELEICEQNLERLESNLSGLLVLDVIDRAMILRNLNEILRQHSIEPANSIEGLSQSKKALTALVENDPRSQELADLAALTKAIERLKLPDGLAHGLQSYGGLAEAFKQEEKAVVDLLLIGLYEQGENVLTARRRLGEEIKNCPLCGQPFEGDLLQHISHELSGLRDLKESRDELEKKRKEALQLLTPLSAMSRRLQDDCQGIESVAKNWSIDSLLAESEKVEGLLDIFRSSLNVPPESLGTDTIDAMHSTLRGLAVAAIQLAATQQNVLSQIAERAEALKEDPSRAKLVNDHTKVHSAIDLWAESEVTRAQVDRLKNVHRGFQALVEDYVQSSIANVERRFEVISSDVQTYFEVLEEHSEGLGRPALKLLADQDRAVVLQVEFHGTPIYPAYRYLSESQLNSFGLAVFLASAKYFNQNFQFLLLDDIINSFDGYKRPQVIKLLKQAFLNHQVLLMTHDSVWSDRLFEACPSWVKYRFIRLDPGIGPIVRDGVPPLAAVEQAISEDEPVRAGRDMGPFLERRLQELCESFEALVKYNQRNEYTLDPLLDRFRVRVKEKLGRDHPLHLAVQALLEETGFRNLCAHWKNPDVQITLEEMKIVVDRWKAIEVLVRCPSCSEFLQYCDTGFACGCGRTKLSRA